MRPATAVELRPAARRVRAVGGSALQFLPLLFAAGLAAGLVLLLLSLYRPGSPGSWPDGSVGGGVAASGPIVPARLAIPAIGVNAPVEARGTVRSTNPFTGQVVDGFGVPTSMSTTSWWSDGPQPGSGQMAVVLGHEQPGGYGVFNDLDRLQPGQPVDLYAKDGSVLHLQVLSAPLTGLAKSTSALGDALNHHPPGADVALVTCGGQFDQSAGQSLDNTVVFATLAGR